MKKLGYGLGLVGLLAALFWWAIGPDWRALAANPPMNTDVLFWSQNQREAAFRMMDRVPFMIKTRPIEASGDVRPLEAGEPLDLGFDIDTYMDEQQHAALVILHKGKVRLEAYNLDFTEKGRWTSFSVAKSLTSTLVGAAIKDGYIESLDDPVSKYVSGLEGSAYDAVTVEQLLTMSSGVGWNEDYSDPNSDVALFNNHVPEDGLSSLVSYMKDLPRAHPAGEVWNYSTGETNLIGVMVGEAVGRPIADYLSEKVWGPAGMQQDASWMLSVDGTEISGCCIQAAARDFARFGQFILEGAKVDGVSIVPDGWIETATVKHKDIGLDGWGYGYQWWTFDDGSFAAHGIFGQSIFIDPNRELVLAMNSNWTTALGHDGGERAARAVLYKHLAEVVDAE